MSIKRIVSFLPSATELLYELGVQENLYGVTHECNYPLDAASTLHTAGKYTAVYTLQVKWLASLENNMAVPETIKHRVTV